MIRAAVVLLGCVGASLAPGAWALAAGPEAAALRGLNPNVLTAADTGGQEPSGMLARDARRRLQEANLRENRAWAAVASKADWERFRDTRLAALRTSLGLPAAEPNEPPRVVVTGTHQGEGYRVENLVYESRPGLVVTANLYAPATPPAKPAPAFLIAHSHHNPRTQGELQDMGMTWARQGHVVLVPDMLGHGERRVHPFRSAADYPGPFKVGRQDYYFRYKTGVQLALLGESLMGWMVRDLKRSIDVLSSRTDVDPKRMILLGSVAGGGDPAGVTAALDRRVAAVVPFNFGGPQPDYAIPDNPDRDFYFFGVPYWESTRCLRNGARDGFAQWLIVGSVAPRGLIYAHEFAWDRRRDPVWPRLNRVFGFYEAEDRLAAATGRGDLKGSPPESSHCNNIGPLHRSGIYPTLERWFAIPVPTEFSDRRPPEDLTALTPEAVRALKPKPWPEVLGDVGRRKAEEAQGRLAARGLTELRQAWAQRLGDVEPGQDVRAKRITPETIPGARVERIVLQVSESVVVPIILLSPEGSGTRRPVILALSQDGKPAALAGRAEAIADWLAGGAAVCLVDVRGTGETRSSDGSRRYNSSATTQSSTEWLLGQTLLGARLRDVRAVLRYLRTREDVDAKRVAVWGDSFALPNPKTTRLEVPPDADRLPNQAEPLGGLLALFTALFEDDVVAVAARGGLLSYRSVLESPFVHVPHDALVPGAIEAGDLAEVARALAPRPLRLEGLVDGRNVEVEGGRAERTYESARTAYRTSGKDAGFQIEPREEEARGSARWLLAQLTPDVKDGPEAPADTPTEKVVLFNGKSLDGLTTWLRETRHEDPRHVFRVEDGQLRITGDGFGYVATSKAYRDFKVVVEFRWGDRTDGGRFVRNSGLLLHAAGPDGNANNTWMASVECQLAQGCVGDLIPISGKAADGSPLATQFESRVVLGPDRRPRWSEAGERREFTRQQLWWSRHDPEFKELLDTQGRFDVESKKGQWTRVECECRGDTITVTVNGQVVNRCEKVSRSSGKILLQTEGFELFVRRFELHPLAPK